MAKVKLDGNFNQEYRKLVKENPDISEFAPNRIDLFKKNPNDTRLDNHSLTKRMTSKWAFSITDDIRIVYKWTSKTTVRFLAIGPHSKVYRKSH